MLQSDLEEMENIIAAAASKLAEKRRQLQRDAYLRRQGLIVASPRASAGEAVPTKTLCLSRKKTAFIRLPEPVYEWVMRRGGAKFARNFLTVCYWKPWEELLKEQNWPTNAQQILLQAYMQNEKE